MAKKWRTTGVKIIVIRLSNRKQRDVIIKSEPFSKLSLLEKDRVILECITNKSNDVAAPDGSRLLSVYDLLGFNATPDTVCDENIGINCVEKHFNQTE